jgi:CubicO group peptidase (beta-lactamase class C family)
MEETFRAGVQSHTIPGVVLLATSRDGKFQYSNTFGNLSIADANSAPISADSPMWIASCTKLLTTIAALQCVERGLLALDADVSPILPEFHAPDILTGFDARGQPTYVKAQNKITLRQLLTHSSGLAYDLFNPTIQKWRASQGQSIAPGTTVRERYLGPLLYEPGTDWEYSPAIDFVGLMVERVSGVRNLQAYMEREIWSPLGIAEMTFFPQGRVDLKARMPAMCIRDEASGKAVLRPRVVQEPPTDAMGGGGIYATPAEYMKVLHAVLKNDGTLLKRETVEDMFRPQLSGRSRAALLKVMSAMGENAINGGLPEGTKRDWGLGGLLVMQDLEGWRSKGTMSWGGMPNLTWWIDREAGICGLYASQILPPEDPKSVEMSVLFEKTMYERYRRERASL